MSEFEKAMLDKKEKNHSDMAAEEISAIIESKDVDEAAAEVVAYLQLMDDETRKEVLTGLKANAESDKAVEVLTKAEEALEPAAANQLKIYLSALKTACGSLFCLRGLANEFLCCV